MTKKKICMLGAFAVGKTSLVQRFVRSIFSEKYLTTIGVKIDKKTVKFKDRQVDLILWDIHGEDEFQTVRMSYLRGASGYLLVVDGTRKDTLDTAFSLQKKVEEAVGKVPFVLVCNKSDLKDEWEINMREIEELSREGLIIKETSAKTGRGVEDTFLALVGKIIEG